MRPISLTPILSQIARNWYTGACQTGHTEENRRKPIRVCSKVFDVQALISMVHAWIKHRDGNGSTVRVVFFDFRKALI